MAEFIVDGLEAVQVDEQHTQPFLVALGGSDGLGHAVFEQAAVGQAGQGVVVGELKELLVFTVAVGHIDARRKVGNRLIRAALDRLDALPLGVDLAIFAAVKKLAGPAAVVEKGVPKGLVKLGRVPVGTEQLDRLAHHLVLVVAGHLAKGRVGRLDHAGGVAQHHAVIEVAVGDDGFQAVQVAGVDAQGRLH